jgi:rhodanese-related sulfurtransferase
MPKHKHSFSIPTLLLTMALLAALPQLALSANDKGYTTVDTSRFMQMMNHKDFTLINVHIPFQGKIPGTDKLLPYNRIAELKDQLPQDKNTPIVIYCMGSEMGTIAARTLSQMGYTHVTQFYNGMIGWREQGGRLIYKQN